MNASASIPLSRWEQACFAFVRSELAPSDKRWRDALRLTLLCAVATTLIVAYHIPYGEFLVIWFIAVSQPDAWASMRKARLRGIATLVGGGIAILGIIAFGDKPGVIVVGQFIFFAVALFLTRTTTVPYVPLLAICTFAIATPAAATDPDASLDKTIWRILLTGAGAVIGTLGQLVLWPDHPEKLLLEQLASRLDVAGNILERLANGNWPVSRQQPPASRQPVSAAMAGQLDLLASAEAGSRWLHQRHTEQIRLITDIEMFHIAAMHLEQLAAAGPSVIENEAIRTRLREIRQRLAELRQALVELRLPEPAANDNGPATVASIGASPIQSAVAELERLVRKMPAAMAFLGVTDADWRRREYILEPVREPVAERTFFTPGCTLSNVEMVRYALKGALAATICYVIYQALNWPGISTCVVTCLLTAQSSVGAGLYKSFMRLAGALLGAIASLAVVVTVLPNLQDAAAFIVVTSALFFAASWVTVGSSRVSYIGIQMGLAVSLVLLNQPNRIIDLAAAGDRIVGVLLGVTVMGLVDVFLWPNFSGTSLRRKLAEAVRSLAAISRQTAQRDWNAASTTALAVHGQMAAALAMYDEGEMEFGSQKADKAKIRHRQLAFINALEEVFHAQLLLLRQRRTMDYQALPIAWQEWLQTLDEAIARYLEAAAKWPDTSAVPDFESQPMGLAQEVQSLPGLEGISEATQRQLIECTEIYRELVLASGNLPT